MHLFRLGSNTLDSSMHTICELTGKVAPSVSLVLTPTDTIKCTHPHHLCFPVHPIYAVVRNQSRRPSAAELDKPVCSEQFLASLRFCVPTSCPPVSPSILITLTRTAQSSPPSTAPICQHTLIKLLLIDYSSDYIIITPF